ncbi:MAG TPA: nucleotidyl transferase AbiEii/AbiGii toxin family protein [Longimicrobiales bacterium]|nr:nucleotidyl transferase AbiEii/AbiGii toxin family protein [Longimicrobiales bacterium]
MISRVSLNERVQEWGLREDVVEKDYVLGWILWGIGSEPTFRGRWVFKGGTCLKKCYLETYRFSEDLDFTVLDTGPIAPDEVLPALRAVLDRVYDASGIDLTVEAPRLRLRPGRRAAEGRVYYIGPRGTPGPASVKLDLDGEERVCRDAEWRQIAHSYDDGLPEPATVLCYSFAEVFAEKLRAMGERGRPRDLYDIISLFRRSDVRPDAEDLRPLLVEKCERKGVSVPTFAQLRDSPTRGELESEWKSMLGHQLPQLPPWSVFWNELEDLFAWLEGAAPPRALASLPSAVGGRTSWTPPPTMRTWGGSPVELLRYAAQSRLVVELDYTDERGRFSRRRVEPYTLYRTMEGNTLLGVFDLHQSGHRSFRIDRIRNVRVTDESFVPRYATEMGAGGIGVAARGAARTLLVPTGPARKKPRVGARPGQIRHVIQCPVCQKRFYRDRYDTRLRDHKAPGRWPCSGRTGIYLGTTG